MSYVEIYKLQNDGSQKVIATCRLVAGVVECEGDDVFLENLTKEGIHDYFSSEVNAIFPKDGIKFLEQLKFNFKSGYLNASEVKDDK